ncbi:MAG: glyoxalase/bleomycin resistance/extradiol dioxygenase family protein [Patescibacteria group bacterium]
MAGQMFVNLAVSNLNDSIKFFRELGFTFNPQFTDENAACMVIGDSNFAMLLKTDFFKTFTKKQLVDAKLSTEAIIALSQDSKEKVDEIFTKAINAGAKEARATEDHGFMYGKSIEDLDGHIWEFFWMDPKHVK